MIMALSLHQRTPLILPWLPFPLPCRAQCDASNPVMNRKHAIQQEIILNETDQQIAYYSYCFQCSLKFLKLIITFKCKPFVYNKTWTLIASTLTIFRQIRIIIKKKQKSEAPEPKTERAQYRDFNSTEVVLFICYSISILSLRFCISNV